MCFERHTLENSWRKYLFTFPKWPLCRFPGHSVPCKSCFKVKVVCKSVSGDNFTAVTVFRSRRHRHGLYMCWSETIKSCQQYRIINLVPRLSCKFTATSFWYFFKCFEQKNLGVSQFLTPVNFCEMRVNI